MRPRLPAAGAAFLLVALVLVGLPAARPAAAGSAAAGLAASPDSSSLLEILARQSTRLDSLLHPESTRLDSAGVDSLVQRFDTGGAEAIRTFHPSWGRRPGVGLSFRPAALTTYNRVEGVRVGAGVGFRPGEMLRLDGAAAYGCSNHRWGGEGSATIIGQGRPWARVQVSELVRPFGPGATEYSWGLQALVAGQDRRDYLRRKEGRVSLWPVGLPGGHLALSGFIRDDSPVKEKTDYSLFGGNSPIHDPNPAVSAGITRGVALEATTAFGGDLLSVAAEAGIAGYDLGGDFGYSWQTGRVTLRPVFPDGGILNVSLEGALLSGSAPYQDHAFLGGEGNLRGYDRLQFVGRRRLSARIEYETGVDILRRTGVSFLKPLKIQFIPFVDLGTTWERPAAANEAAGADSLGNEPGLRWGKTLGGSIRSSVGIGFQRELWLPGVRAVRLDLIRRADGSDNPWGFWFRILPFGS